MAIIRLDDGGDGEEANGEVALSRAENPWKPQCLDPSQAAPQGSLEGLERRALGLLNRLAPQNLPTILGDILALLSADAGEAAGPSGSGTSAVARVLFAKAVQEPLYSHCYSQLSAQLAGQRELGGAFRGALLGRMRELFAASAGLDGAAVAAASSQSALASAVEVDQTKQLVRGGIRFLGELWRAGGFLSAAELGEAMGPLVGAAGAESEWGLECVYVLLNGVGDALEAAADAQGLLRDLLDRCAAALRRPSLSLRLRFLLGHLHYLSQHHWQQRLDEFADGPLSVLQ